MPQRLSRIGLSLVVFLTGACVLVVEIVATRILSPYFGNTIFTVSSVISVILAALSLGYYAGGKLADRRPSFRWFFGIIMASGLLLLGLHLTGTVALPAFGYGLSITTGPLVSAMGLFFLPALLLGTLSPYAVKLEQQLHPEQGVGSISGTVFFWSTLGSIFGSLSAGFILIPSFGIDAIVIGNAVILFLLGLVPLFLLDVGRAKLFGAVLVFSMLLGTLSVFVYATNAAFVHREDGVYEKIQIFEGELYGRPVRFFQQDRTSSAAMFLDTEDPTDLVFEYTKYYALYRLFNPDPKNILVIGGAAYSIPKAILHELPEAMVDVAEIEPAAFELARQYFQVEATPRLLNHIEDGRRFLHDATVKYDLIFSDAFSSFNALPAHMTTLEFFSTAKEALSENGVFIMNVIGDLSQGTPSFVMSEIKTFRFVFPNSLFFALQSPASKDMQNFIFVGSNHEDQIELNIPALEEQPEPLFRGLAERLIDVEAIDLSSYPALIDDYAPVEYYAAVFLQRAKRR